MIIERTSKEILVRLPANVDLTELQNMLDYLAYKEASADSKANQEDADKISEEINTAIWEQFNNRLKPE